MFVQCLPIQAQVNPGYRRETRTATVVQYPIVTGTAPPAAVLQEVKIAIVAKYTEKDVEGRAYTGICSNPNAHSNAW